MASLPSEVYAAYPAKPGMEPARKALLVLLRRAEADYIDVAFRIETLQAIGLKSMIRALEIVEENILTEMTMLCLLIEDITIKPTIN